MASNQLGLGSLVKVDHDADASYTTVGLVRTITPPARVRIRIDGTVLADTLKTYEMGVEDFSELQFLQLWEPGDSNHEILDTLFGSKAEVNWQVLYGSGPVQTDQFAGKVSDLTPEPIEIDALLARVVMVQRTGAITRS